MGTPFKMRGSPFQRNFGIGSPVKQQPDKKEFIENYVNPTVNLTKEQTGPVEDGSGGANFTNDNKTNVVTKNTKNTKTNSTEKLDDRFAPIGTTKKIDTDLPKALGTVNTDTDTEKARELTSHLTTKQKRINPTKEDDADDNRKKVLLKRKGNGSGNSITNIKNKIVTKRKNERINERIKK
jgi:hypothetical protein